MHNTMEEIRIYHSYKRNIGTLLACLLFVACGCFLLSSDDIVAKVIGIATLLFFGGGLLLVVYTLTKHFLQKKPCIVVTERSIVLSGIKEHEIRFCDVEEFYMTKKTGNLICVKYNDDVEEQKIIDSSVAERMARKFNNKVTGAQESISVEGLTMDAVSLLDILNDRLEKSRRQKR